MGHTTHRFNGLQFAVIMFAALGSLSYGYAAGIIATTLGQPSFIEYFGLATRSNATSLISAMVVGFQCGGFLGALASPWAADRLGRKSVLYIAAAGLIVTSALQAGSVNLPMFLAFRTLGGVAVGGILVAVPLYQSEIAPANIRGRLVAMHGMMLALGYVISAWFSLAFFYAKDGSASWRAPLAIQIVFPLALVIGMFFLPESPRWLVTRDRNEEAKKILVRLHTAPDDLEHTFANAEFDSIVQQEQIDRELAVGWMDILRTRSNRKRAVLAFFSMFLYPSTGTLTITNYLPSLLGRLGFSPGQQLALAGGYITYAPLGNIVAAYLIERIGRRKMFLIGLAGTAAALVGETIVIARGLDTKAGQGFGVFFFFMHLVFFATFLDATTFVYSTEIWPQHLRAKGLSIGISGLFVGSIIWLGAAPTAFAAINHYFYIVFIAITVVLGICIALWWPETKGLPLESIGALFGDAVVTDPYENADKPSSQQSQIEYAEKA